MKLVVLAAVVLTASCGIIDDDHIQHHERATSYQNIHIEHFHAVPTYVKKEDVHLLKNPISLGTSSSKVEVHHGDKHDHGYAFANAENNVHGHAFEDFGALTSGGHEVGAAALQVQDQGDDYSQLQGHLGLGHFASGFDGYSNGEDVQYDSHDSR